MENCGLGDQGLVVVEWKRVSCVGLEECELRWKGVGRVLGGVGKC